MAIRVKPKFSDRTDEYLSLLKLRKWLCRQCRYAERVGLDTICHKRMKLNPNPREKVCPSFEFSKRIQEAKKE